MKKLSKIKNAREFPRILYGLHFYPGVAEYAPEKDKPYRIYVTENAIRKMGPTFAGKPVYVRHVNDVNLRTLQQDADGYVIESFFNKADGKHWTKFMVVSDKGQAAIRNGWKLSNCYMPTSKAPKGVHNGLSYDEELVDGVYEHLAIVDDPRYEESMVLSPEEFKEYCAEKEAELTRLSNSKDKKKVQNKGESKMQIFKREAIENSLDLDETLVVLPKSKKEVTLANAIEAADKLYNMHGYANAEHMVKVGEEEMSVGKMTKNYMKMCEEKAQNEKDEDDTEENSVDSDDEKPEPELKNKKKNAKKKNESDDEDESEEPELKNKKKNAKKKNSVSEDESEDDCDDEVRNSKKVKNSKKSDDESEDEESDEEGGHFHRLMNAGSEGEENEDEVIELSHNQLARGRDRY